MSIIIHVFKQLFHFNININYVCIMRYYHTSILKHMKFWIFFDTVFKENVIVHCLKTKNKREIKRNKNG
jgi:hypothetical protein